MSCLLPRSVQNDPVREVDPLEIQMTLGWLTWWLEGRRLGVMDDH